MYRASTSVLRTHESKDFLGGIIASLSIPWGFNKGDEDLGGYHLIWPRDLVENAGGLLAAGADDDALRVLHYLEATQEADGHWAQNMWLDGRPYWNGLQMDETAFPILLVDLLRRESPRSFRKSERWWPMVRKAAAFIVANGPVTQQDRWEEDGGYSPFTLAAEISALLIAADLAESMGQPQPAEFLREMADTWNDNIERWTYAVNSDLARQVGVEGYYVRITPAGRRRSRLAPAGIRSHQESCPRQFECAGSGDRQSGCAGAGALRLARSRRSANAEHDQSDRCLAARETSSRSGLVSL